MYNIVVGVTKMGNIVPRAGMQPTYISGILGECVHATPCRLPDVTPIPTPTCVCSSLPQRSVQTTTISYVPIITLRQSSSFLVLFTKLANPAIPLI